MTEIISSEEFAIYLNYVRKLGFEETPDYDFLRELFTKVLKNSGEAEDGVYDWMMLNGGKGWEAGAVSLVILSSSTFETNVAAEQSGSNLPPSTNQPGYESGRHHRASGQPRERDRERERAERHAQRAAVAAAAITNTPGGLASPSAALVRNGSKTGRNPSGSATPNANSSAMAVKGVSAVGGKRSSANVGSGGGSASHPYASASQVQIGGFDRSGNNDAEYSAGVYRGSAAQVQSGPLMSTQGAGHAGGGAGGNGDYIVDDDATQRGFSLIRFLTCRCG